MYTTFCVVRACTRVIGFALTNLLHTARLNILTVTLAHTKTNEFRKSTSLMISVVVTKLYAGAKI